MPVDAHLRSHHRSAVKRCSKRRNLPEMFAPGFPMESNLVKEFDDAGHTARVLGPPSEGPGNHGHIADVIVDGTVGSPNGLRQGREDGGEVCLGSQVAVGFGING